MSVYSLYSHCQYKHTEERTASAVYAFIQAWRTLGHERIYTQKIAEALCLSHDEVLQAIRDFEMPGVEPSQ